MLACWIVDENQEVAKLDISIFCEAQSRSLRVLKFTSGTSLRNQRRWISARGDPLCPSSIPTLLPAPPFLHSPTPPTRANLIGGFVAACVRRSERVPRAFRIIADRERERKNANERKREREREKVCANERERERERDTIVALISSRRHEQIARRS